MPNEATLDDVIEAYNLSAKSMLKANALYRDGSKLSQPLSAASISQLDIEDEVVEMAPTNVMAAAEIMTKKVFQHAERNRLPFRRAGYTKKPVSATIKFTFVLVSLKMAAWVKSLSICTRKGRHLEQ